MTDLHEMAEGLRRIAGGALEFEADEQLVREAAACSGSPPSCSVASRLPCSRLSAGSPGKAPATPLAPNPFKEIPMKKFLPLALIGLLAGCAYQPPKGDRYVLKNPHLGTWHDDHYKVTCWAHIKSSYYSGPSCIPDWMLTPPSGAPLAMEHKP